MLVAAVSGILMHRHLFSDIFTLRGRGRVVGLRDLHSVAGTWTLPHAFVLAFTGAYLSFTIAVGLPMLAKIAFKGDVREMVTVLNGLRAVDPRPAAPANLDDILSDARKRADAPLLLVGIDNRGRADARITVFPAPRRGELSAYAAHLQRSDWRAHSRAADPRNASPRRGCVAARSHRPGAFRQLRRLVVARRLVRARRRQRLRDLERIEPLGPTQVRPARMARARPRNGMGRRRTAVRDGGGRRRLFRQPAVARDRVLDARRLPDRGRARARPGAVGAAGRTRAAAPVRRDWRIAAGAAAVARCRRRPGLERRRLPPGRTRCR